MDERAGAHRARLLGDKKIAFVQAPVADRGFRLGQGEHLGVGRRILEQFDLIKGARNDLPRSHHDRADWHLFRLVSAPGEAQGLAHEIGVTLQINDFFHGTICFENQSPIAKELLDAAGAPLYTYGQRATKHRNMMPMKKLVAALLASCLVASATSAATEQEIVDQSVEILRAFRQMPEQEIPRRILDDARGLAIIRVLKIGFGVSGKGGEGVVVARTGHGWSGPSFIGLGGAGWGLQIGAQLTDFIFVLNNDAAVRAFSRDGNVKLGADVSAAAGPVGRDLQAGVTSTAAVYTYSRSKGLFAGISLEGAIIGTQKTANARYYGRVVGARSILAGRVSPTRGTDQLLQILNRY